MRRVLGGSTWRVDRWWYKEGTWGKYQEGGGRW